ncbi:MAG: hypothetical protein P8L66_07760 [Rhodospirillaceae bacterium]|nr:hypothetical protein [Rhodospirillaceae bacterium]
MPFKSSDLTVLAYANGYTLCHYLTDDQAGEFIKSGYLKHA